MKWTIITALGVAATFAGCDSDTASSEAGSGAAASSGDSSTTAASSGGAAATSTSVTTGSSGAGGSGGSAAATVPCAGNECMPGQVCCFDNSNNTQIRCDAPNGCDNNHIELRCNHPDDCPGGSCCSIFNGMVQTMACKSACTDNNEFTMCSGPDQSVCPAMTTCSQAAAGNGYHYCRP